MHSHPADHTGIAPKKVLKDEVIKNKHIAKWLAITVLGLAFMFIVRHEISSVLTRTSRIKVSSRGITLETPLGITDVTPRLSTTQSYRERYPQEEYKSFFSERHNYVKGWPVESVWQTARDLQPPSERLMLFIQDGGSAP